MDLDMNSEQNGLRLRGIVKYSGGKSEDTPSSFIDQVPSWVFDAFESWSKAELTTLSQRGPAAFPMTPLYNREQQAIVFTSEIAHARKAINMKRDPRVSVTYTHPTGTHLGYKPVIVVQGLAKVIDDDLENGWLKYFEQYQKRSPQSSKQLTARRSLASHISRRTIMEIHPKRIFAWKDGDTNKKPEVWGDVGLAASKPGSARLAGAYNLAAEDVSEMNTYEFAVVTYIDHDGYPLGYPSGFKASQEKNQVSVSKPGGISVRRGQDLSGSVLFHSFDENGGNQRYVLFLGELIESQDGFVFNPKFRPVRRPPGGVDDDRVARRRAEEYLREIVQSKS